MRIRCTACSALLQVADELAGKRIRCPRCKEPTVATPAPVEKARPQSAIAVRAGTSATKPTRPRKVVDEDEEDETPKPRKKKKKKKRKKDNTPMIVGIAVSGGVAVSIAIITAVLVLTRPAADVPPNVVQVRAADAELPGKGGVLNPRVDLAKDLPKGFAKDVPKVAEVPVVESSFKLPDVSEAEWFERGKSELKGMRRTLGEDYDKVGRKDPKWDEPARKALELAAQMYAKKQETSPRNKDVYPLIVKAIQAGCDDPLILFHHARVYGGVESIPLRGRCAAVCEGG